MHLKAKLDTLHVIPGCVRSIPVRYRILDLENCGSYHDLGPLHAFRILGKKYQFCTGLLSISNSIRLSILAFKVRKKEMRRPMR